MGSHFRSLLGSLRRNSRTGERTTPPDPPGGLALEATPAVGRPAASADGAGDSAQEILDLIELEVGAMIRRLERAANSVPGGAKATGGSG